MVQYNNNITQILLDWFSSNARILPWRKNRSAYRVWVSEVILQQTQVVQGEQYFNRFVSRFPTVESLAIAGEHEVLKLWQGLGYYSRARNMHAAAKQVVECFDGKFPEEFKALKSLKGIGDYTAAAIASIVSAEPVAVVDGNVLRFISRLFGVEEAVDSAIGKKIVKNFAQSLLPKANPGTFNEAMMEFGALKCVPRNAQCDNCIFSDVCSAKRQNRVYDFPVRRHKTKVSEREMHFLVVETSKGIWFEKQTSRDFWKNMYLFPFVDSSNALLNGIIDKYNVDLKFEGELVKVCNVNHILTHRKVLATFWKIEGDLPEMHSNSILVKVTDLKSMEIPVPKLIDNFLRNYMPDMENC